MPSAELSQRIAARTHDLDALLSNLTETIFSSSFEVWLRHAIASATNIIVAWEERTGLRWFPNRQLPNRLFMGPDAFDRLGEQWGLSAEQVQATVNRGRMRAARSHMGNPWIHDWTTFPDRLLEDPSEEEQNKAALRDSIHTMRLLFGELSNLSPDGARAAHSLYDASPLCDRCPSCCRLPFKIPSVLVWVHDKFASILGLDFTRQVMTTLFNGMALYGATHGDPASLMFLATALGKTFWKRELCETALQLIDNSTDQAGTPVVQELAQNLEYNSTTITMEFALPEPQSYDFEVRG